MREMKYKIWVDGFIEEMKKKDVPPDKIIQQASKFFEDDSEREELVKEKVNILEECTCCSQKMLWNSQKGRYYCPVCE